MVMVVAELAVITIIVITIAIFWVIDNKIYSDRLDGFEFRAMEFAEMYNFLTPKVLHGDPDAPEINTFEFFGTFFKSSVQINDLKSLYRQMNLAICEVLDSYDRIGERYLEYMDEETEKEIHELYDIVLEINNEIRIQCWKLGVK